MRQNQRCFSETGRNTPEKKTRLVIETNTIYEIDEQCYECLMNQRQNNNMLRQKKRWNYTDKMK